MAKRSKTWTRWTSSVIDEFKIDYPYMEWDELMRKYPFKKGTIAAKASELGIKRMVGAVYYTPDEDQVIIDGFYNGLSDKEISISLSRSEYSVEIRRQRLGLKHRPGQWTDPENDILRKYYSVMPAESVAKMLPGRSRDAVVLHAARLGLSGYRGYHEYTSAEEQYIVDNYLDMTDAEIGKSLGHSKESIKNRRNRLGCHRPKERSRYDGASEFFRKYNSEWKEDSMRACGYRCIVTGKRFDDIHHLVSLNTIIIDACADKNIDIMSFDPNYASEAEKLEFIDAVKSEQAKHPLGVCLSKEVHTQFHNRYGYGNNTPDQFYEFINTYYPELSIC